jgi:hypothetical protein
VGPVPRRGGGVAARAGADDHRGGANLTGRGLWRPVRGAVAGVHGDEVAGAVAGCNRRGKGVSVFWVQPHTRGCPSRCF